MASHAIYNDIQYVEAFNNGGADVFRLTIQVWLCDLAGQRSTKTNVTLDIAAADTISTIQTNFSNAVIAKATALGYTVSAGTVIMPTFTKV